jgi:hypothetical protein
LSFTIFHLSLFYRAPFVALVSTVQDSSEKEMTNEKWQMANDKWIPLAWLPAQPAAPASCLLLLPPA